MSADYTIPSVSSSARLLVVYEGLHKEGKKKKNPSLFELK
jgi:hypothetical protein